ncbi:MAG: 16S rRNA (cytidine(1402)-2'-O)-methyltransferase, partial [Thermoleophilia bacterium]|nr:16S rRNA (cytidine(1402)-2'-O)-methyltransferase [Thermoleophilia bacterium]
RVLDTLSRVDVVACEDTRRTRILLDRYNIKARLVSFHGANEERRLQTLLPLLRAGQDVALVSDAGLPAVSDPGFSLVRACVAEGIPVTVLPGPSAVITALVLSGIAADRFAFVGFLARGKAKLLAQLEAFSGTGAALVAFESPQRLPRTLAAIAERWPDREVAVCRELTKLHEEVIRGMAHEVLGRLGEPVRGEIVLVLEAAETAPGGTVADEGGRQEDPMLRVLEKLVAEGVRTKTAAEVVAGLTGLSLRRAYALAVAAKRRSRRT